MKKKFPCGISAGMLIREPKKTVSQNTSKSSKSSSKNSSITQSNEDDTEKATADFNNYLDSFFSETISVHGVLVELFGFGVLLTGKSGIGKSETALELIHRGHRLIADDMVKFFRDTQGDVVGKSAELPFFMEIQFTAPISCASFAAP